MSESVEGSWRADVLPGFSQTTIELDEAEPVIGEPEDVEVVATLVRQTRSLDAARALLYVHGWNDYFFQTELADFFADHGFAFYALDLRRYGRSLRPGQLGGYIADLDDYHRELDAAVGLIGESHDSVTLMAHSTGGLIASLWADQRASQAESEPPTRVDGLILNSPWLDLQGSAMVRTLGTPIIASLANRRPTAVLRLPESGFYARSLHASLDGEWEYDQEWKSSPGPGVRAGWLQAVLRGHHRVAAGLSLRCPILVMCSTKTDFRRRWDEGLRRADTVLDVEQIASRATKLGRLVTVARIEGGMHDLVLSAPEVRAEVYAQMARWMAGYLPPAEG